MDDDKPVSQFEGRPCGICGASLRAVKVNPSTFRLQGGGLFAGSEYECEGATPHRFGEMTDSLPQAGRTVTVKLIRLEDDPEEG